ncbi:Ca-activated chloride channel family protein [Armatimonadetes bacterium GXS]|nr:Ca-activated chloride channel family protein [Armatimonadetes bacterium GXS]
MRQVSITGLLWLCLLAPISAQGVLILPDDTPPDHRIREWRPFRVKEHTVRVTIRDSIAETTIEQLFVNESSVPQEAEYWFPVPRNAAISRFTMVVGDKEIEARLLSADEARRIYEGYVRRRRDPALLEFAEQGILRARVFPIPPNGSRRITLRYVETLPRTGEMTAYRLPLRVARALTRPTERVRMEIELRTSKPLSSLYCPSHPEAWIRRESPTRAVIQWEGRNLIPERDFLLYFASSTEPYDLQVFTYRAYGDGYFLMLFTPASQPHGERLPKHLVFVFDRTGSMAGEKIQQAKAAFRYCLSNLQEGDKFNLIFFNEQPTKLFETLVPATREHVQRAIREVDALEARGGTNIYEALREAFRSLPIERTPALRAVVFLTDGLPTVGETSPERILQAVREWNAGRAIRLFAFGVGYDVNVHLLDKLCEQNRGAPEYVRPEENIEAKVSQFYDRINLPLLTDLRLTLEGMDAYDIYPVELPDLFQGDQLVIVGRYRGSGRAAVVLEGLARQRKERIRQVVEFPARADTMDFVPRLWATRKIGYLLDEWRLHQNEEVRAEIIRLAQEYGIVTQFTSFLIEEDMVLAREADVLQRAITAPGGFGGAPASGKTAVDQSQTAQRLRGTLPQAPVPGAAGQSNESLQLGYYSAPELAIRAAQRIRNIGDRTFYQKGSQWIDSRYKPDEKLPLIQIAAYSDAYFELLKRQPKLRQYLSLGEEVILRLERAVVQISSTGKTQLSEQEWKLLQ